MLEMLFGARPQATSNWGRGWTRGRVRSLAGPVIDEDLALTQSAVWCCSRIISEPIGGLPLITYERVDDWDRRPATDLNLYDLLKTSPNPSMGANPFRIGRTLHQLNYGNGFAEIEFARLGDPTSDIISLWPIHPSRVRPARPGDRYENGQTVAAGNYLVRNDDGSTTTLKPEEMLHVAGALPEDGLWGKSVIAHARESIGAMLGVERHGAAFFGTGAQPKAVLKLPGMKDKEKRTEFREEWKQVHASPDSGEVAILPTEADYTVISLTNNDSQFLETLKDGSRRVCQWYRVPPHMVADMMAGASFASIEMMSLEFVVYCLMPWIRAWEDQLNLKLFSRQNRKRYFIEFNLNGLLRGDITARMNAYRIAIGSGIMTLNEVARLENLPNRGPAGDVLYLPANLTTAEQMWKNPPAGGQAAGPGSDHSGAPDDEGGSPKKTKMEAADAALHEIQASVSADHRAAMAPVPTETISRSAAQAVVFDVLSRMFAKEANAAQRAADKGGDFDGWVTDFYAKHRSTLTEAIAPAQAVLGSLWLAQETSTVVEALANDSASLLRIAYDSQPKKAFAEQLAKWPTERAREVAEKLIWGTLP